MTKRPKNGQSQTVQNVDNNAGKDAGQKYAISPLNGAKMPIGGHPGTHRPKAGMGVGRKADEVRKALAGIAADKSGFVRDVIDGNVLQKIRVPASVLKQYMTCECGELRVSGDDPHIAIEVEASPGVDTRLRAYDTAARYGIGQLKEVSVEHVRERVRQTLEIIRASVEPAKADAIVAELKGVWT